MIGTMDGARASGAAAGGGNGNPDAAGMLEGVGGLQEQIDDIYRRRASRGMPTPLGGWSIGEPGGDQTGPAVFPPSERHLPGFVTTAGPTDAPDALQDRHSYADTRLAGMWGAQEFYGPKPGRQTGSLVNTAGRDIRLPLPTAPPVGGVSGPTSSNGWSIGSGGNWTGPALFPEPYYPYPSWGPKPSLPNCDSDEDQSAGRPQHKPQVQGEEMNSGASSSDATNENEKEETDSTGGGGTADSDDCDPWDEWDSGDLEDAMRSQDNWFVRWVTDKFSGAVADESDPDVGKSSAVRDFNPTLYDIADRVSNGALTRGIEGMSPAAYNALGNALIAADMIDNVATALGAGALVKGGLKAAGKALAKNADNVVAGGAKASGASKLAGTKGGATLADEALDLARPIGKSASQAEDTYVYVAMKNGEPVYTGITTNLQRRLAQHGKRFDVLNPLGRLARDKARAVEQVLYESNPGFTNIRNPISPRNKQYYDEAVKWGKQWLEAQGINATFR